MKKLLCLALGLMLSLAALPALAELSLNPDQWTEPFDYTMEDYCEAMETLSQKLAGAKGEWHDADAPEGYRVRTFTGKNLADIVVLADEDGRVLAIGTQVTVNASNSGEAGMQGQMLSKTMRLSVYASRMTELGGSLEAFRDEEKAIAKALDGYRDGMAHKAMARKQDAYKAIEAAGHYANILLSSDGMTYTCVFAPIAAQPE